VATSQCSLDELHERVQAAASELDQRLGNLIAESEEVLDYFAHPKVDQRLDSFFATLRDFSRDFRRCVADLNSEPVLAAACRPASRPFELDCPAFYCGGATEVASHALDMDCLTRQPALAIDADKPSDSSAPMLVLPVSSAMDPALVAGVAAQPRVGRTDASVQGGRAMDQSPCVALCKEAAGVTNASANGSAAHSSECSDLTATMAAWAAALGVDSGHVSKAWQETLEHAPVDSDADAGLSPSGPFAPGVGCDANLPDLAHEAGAPGFLAGHSPRPLPETHSPLSHDRAVMQQQASMLVSTPENPATTADPPPGEVCSAQSWPAAEDCPATCPPRHIVPSESAQVATHEVGMYNPLADDGAAPQPQPSMVPFRGNSLSRALAGAKLAESLMRPVQAPPADGVTRATSPAAVFASTLEDKDMHAGDRAAGPPHAGRFAGGGVLKRSASASGLASVQDHQYPRDVFTSSSCHDLGLPSTSEVEIFHGGSVGGLAAAETGCQRQSSPPLEAIGPCLSTVANDTQKAQVDVYDRTL